MFYRGLVRERKFWRKDSSNAAASHRIIGRKSLEGQTRPLLRRRWFVRFCTISRQEILGLPVLAKRQDARGWPWPRGRQGSRNARRGATACAPDAGLAV